MPSVRALALIGMMICAASAAHGNTITFGTPVYTGSCTTSGVSVDNSCTHSATLNNGSLDHLAQANIRAQASAETRLAGDPTSEADITVSYTIPYTLTRELTWVDIPDFKGGGWEVVVPLQQLRFSFFYGGAAAYDASGGGSGSADAFEASLLGVSGLGGISVLSSKSASVAGSSGSAIQPFSGPSTVSVSNESVLGKSVGEISIKTEIPTNYRSWEDLVAPFVNPDIGAPLTITQSLTGSITASFQLRAQSKPKGGGSPTPGAEAIACAGLTSTLRSFALDDGLDCGTGLIVNARVDQSGSTSFLVAPEPTASLLLLTGLLPLAARGRRRH